MLGSQTKLTRESYEKARGIQQGVKTLRVSDQNGVRSGTLNSLRGTRARVIAESHRKLSRLQEIATSGVMKRSEYEANQTGARGTSLLSASELINKENEG